ncbi:TonB-dependent Receptor Plug Domain protein [anaerobic digester metagenome]
MVRSKLSSVFISLIVLFWALSAGAAAQNSTLKGTVKDITGTPLIGVNVIQKGTTNGTVTDVDGNFSINVPANATIVFTYIGFSAQEVVWDGASAMNVVMHEDAELLDEVVVVGYGTQKKVNLTGAVDNMSESRLASLHVNTMGEALQGQLPGVYVSTADGKPGRFSSFNIRGTTSINGGDPLIVIDGVPQSSNSLNNLSPNDIEDISILKDAASATIYGARASFGVILITTKTGKKGKSKVEYNNYFGFSKATIVPEIYDNPVDYIDINQNEFNKYIGQSYFTDAQVEYPYLYEKDPTLPQAKLEIIGGRSTLLLGGKVYNYYKEWLRKYTPQQNHRISVSGANDSFQYYLAGDYNYEEGNIKFKPEKIKRYTLLSNLRYNLNKNVSLFNNTTMVKRDEEHPNQYLYGFTSNVYRFIENSNAMMPEYVDIDGKMVPTDIGFYRRFLEKQSGIEKDVHDVKTTLGVDISLLNKDLEIRIDGTYQNENTDYLRWWDNVGPYLSNSFNNRNIVLDYYSDAGPAKIYRSNWKSVLTNINAYGTYSKLINDHDIKVMGGYNQEHYDYLYSYAEKLYPLPVDQHSLNLATGASNTRDDDNRNSSRSIFSRLNYNWKSRYLVEFNTSYFLSSRFEKQKRGHGYLSSSAAWRISEEAFFEPLKTVVPNLKLRFSYGSLGNANIGSYDYIPIMSVSQSGFSLDGNLVNLTSAPAPKSDNFTWETVESFNLGLDFSLFNSKFNTTLDVFRRDTKDMLANYRSLPSVFGANVPKENIASLRTKGWELNVNWNDSFTLLDDRFMYGVYFNVSDYMSQITDYYNPTNYLADYYVGQTIGEIWGLTTLGYFLTDEEAKKSAVLSSSSTSRVYASAGTIKFEDKNNDGVISWGDRTLDNPGDYRVIGNETPRYQFGLTLNGAWKGFDMNVFFNGVGKRDIYPGAEAVNFWGPYNRKYQVMTKHVIENRWTPENPNAYFPKPQGYIALGGNDLGQPQTKYMQNAAYIRLKNFSFGYSLPHDLVKKIKLNSLRFFVSGQNLWEYTKLHFSLDPEGLMKDPDANQGSVGLGTAYPIQRVYSFGAQIQF